MLPPWVRACLEELLPIFERYLVRDLALLTRPPHVARILDLCPPELKAAALKRWTEGTSSPQRWAELRLSLEEWQRKHQEGHPLAQIVFTYLWPRLDVAVSTGLNHLLKAPFVVHPSTGRVCVPFTAQDVLAFSPEAVPQLARLVAELDSGQDALAPYLATFDAFLLPLVQAEKLHRLKRDPHDVDLEDLA